MADKYKDIEFKFINYNETTKLFNELQDKVKGKIMISAMKKSSKLITDEAKSNFNLLKKGKSKTGYLYFNKSFKTRELRSKFGVIAGITKAGYKYRFISFGTGKRSYLNKNGKVHNTGKLEANKFWQDAVTAKQDEAIKSIENNIIKETEKTVIKYNKKYA